MVQKSELFFLRILIPYSAGIILMYNRRDEELLKTEIAAVGLLFCLLFLANLLYLKCRLYQFNGWLGLASYLFWFVFGAMICAFNHHPLNSNIAPPPHAYLKAWVANEPEIKNGIMRFEASLTAKVDAFQVKKLTGKLLISIRLAVKRPLRLAYGDELIVSGKCTAIAPPQNPGEFDFSAWLMAKNINYQLFIDQQNVVKLPSNVGNPIIRYAIGIRQKQIEVYRRLIKDDQAFAVASTLVLGYRSDLSKETLAAYSKTGTIHALSVSGAHVGIVYLLLNWLLFFVNRHKVWKLILICLAIWSYSLLTGFSPSVLRSAMMLSIYLVAKTFNRDINNYNILAFTAFCMLTYNPFLIWDVGFQLSFIAVFGLVYLQPKIYQMLYVKNKLMDKLWSATAMSLAAQLATFPLSIYYFHQFPVYFIISNLFILLPLSAMMYLGIVILTIKLYFLAPVFEWVITFTHHGLNWIATLPFAGISGIWINRCQLVLLTLMLGFITYAFVNRKKKILYMGLGLSLCLQLSCFNDKLKRIDQQKILFFSLRRHYATAFIEGNSAILVTDVSPNTKEFEFSVKPALDQLGIAHLSTLTWEKDTVIKHFVKKTNQLIFFGFKLLLLDSRLNRKKVMGLPKFDAVWLHVGAKKSLIDLRQECLFSRSIIDASNTAKAIAAYQEQAHKIDVPLHVCKKNTSYLIDLKPLNNE